MKLRSKMNQKSREVPYGSKSSSSPKVKKELTEFQQNLIDKLFINKHNRDGIKEGILLMGVPGAGKSTFLKTVLPHIVPTADEHVTISRDYFVEQSFKFQEAVDNGCSDTTITSGQALIKETMTLFTLTKKCVFEGGFKFILDITGSNGGDIGHILNLCSTYGYHLKVFFIKVKF